MCLMASKRGLTQIDYVEAALAYVDEHGASHLTARSLGDVLGVDPTAVYRHFESLAELANAVVDHVFGLILEVPLRGRTPRARLAQRIANVHEVLYEHPNAVGLMLTGSGLTPNANRITAEAIDLLSELGLSGQDLVVCHQMLESHIVGTHLFDLGGSPHHLVGRRTRLRAVDHPVLDRQYPDDASVETINRKAFAASIEALLDYCEARASGGAKPRTSRAQQQ